MCVHGRGEKRLYEHLDFIPSTLAHFYYTIQRPLLQVHIFSGSFGSAADKRTRNNLYMR